MTKTHGPWRIEETEDVYRNDFIHVLEDRVVRPDGRPGRYATVRMRPGVCVLAVGEDVRAYLVRQFRYAAGRESLEAVTGAIDGGEDPLEAARRETREEAGIEGENWTRLGTVDVDTSIVHCPVHLFLARGLSFTTTDREGTEEIRVVDLPLAEAVRRVMRGEITHGPSCVLILKARDHLRNS